MRLVLAVTALICCALATAATAVAAPADLDRSFGGGDGIVEVTGPAGQLPSGAGARMAIGPHDEIFVLFSNYPPCDPPFGCAVGLTVARYTPDGQLDPSFASAVPQLTVKQSALENEFDLAVGTDGKPVLAAYGGAEGGLLVARLGLDGNLDPTFGVGGVAPYTGAHLIETVRGRPKVAVQPDGKVVVAVAGGHEGEGTSAFVVRYLANGALDPGFGSGGEARPLVGTQTKPAGVFVGADGSITIPMPLCCVGGTPLYGEGFSVARLTAAGQPDPGLALDGSLFFPTPGAEGAVEAATPTAAGGLLVSYEASTPTVSTIGNLIELAPNGALDPGFGNGGGLRLFNRVGAVSPSDLAVDGRGRVVGVGWEGRIAVFRLRSDGGRDRTFDGGERVVLPYGGGGATEYEVGIQSNGRILALGDSGLGAFKRFGLIGLRGGDDRSRCLGKRATIVGTARKDELVGTPHRDVIAALGGRDEVRGLGGPDLICGGKGRDKLFGGAGHDEVRP